MSHPLIPRANLKFNTFQGNVYNYCNLNAVLWGIAPDAMDELLAYKNDWEPKYTATAIRSQATTLQRSNRNESRAAYEPWLRGFLKQYVLYNPKVDIEGRMGMGIRLRRQRRKQIPAPDTIVDFFAHPMQGCQLRITFRQEGGEEGTTFRRKPDDVARCEFAYKVGGDHAPLPDECTVYVSTGRSPMWLRFNRTDAGKPVHIYARWVSATNKPGRWASCLSTFIPG